MHERAPSIANVRNACGSAIKGETLLNSTLHSTSVVAVYFYFTLPSILSALQFTESLLLLSLRR